MAVAFTTRGDDLIARADRAIASARATRDEVRAGLAAAGRRSPRRPWAGDPVPAKPSPAALPSLDSLVEPWWSVAQTLSVARAIIGEADHELDVAWRHVAPMIETPLALVRG